MMIFKTMRLVVAVAGLSLMTATAQAQPSAAQVDGMLTEFEAAWSSQDTAAVLGFFADEFRFEDVPLGLVASNKEELQGILDYTFKHVPNFKMDIMQTFKGDGFVTTIWKQSGVANIEEGEMKLKDFAYEVTTTSVITLSDEGLITSVTDNWNAGIFNQ